MHAPQVLRTLQAASDLPVAPQVAGRIAAAAGVDREQATAAATGLGSGQLAGLAVLPAALPLLSDDAVGASPDRAAHRLLLAAALSVTDRVDVLLSAAATDVEVVLSEPVQAHLRFHGGRFAFRSEAERSRTLATASSPGAEDVHRALWHAHRRHGLGDVGLWHAVHGGVETDERALRALLAVGIRLLARGNAEAAFRVAEARPLHRTPALRGRAAALGGRAALALGCFDDALRCFAEAGRTDPEIRAEALAGHTAAEAFLNGPEPGSDPFLRVASQLPALRTAAATATDRAALAGIDAIAEVWWTRPEDADERHARLYLSLIPAAPSWPWGTAAGALSPLIEAHVRGQQAGFLLHAGRPHEAAAVLGDALTRLPMTHIGGGVTSSALRALIPTAPELSDGFAESLRSIGPAQRVAYAVEPVIRGERTIAVTAPTKSSASAPRAIGALSALTERERAVIEQLLQGKSNRDIGERLRISARTVEVHLTNAFRKLRVRNRAEALAVLLARD